MTLTVAQIIPRLESGGAEQAVLAVHRGLLQAGHRAIVVSSGGRMVEKILALGGDHVQLPVHGKNPLQLIKNAQSLGRMIRQKNIHVLHARSRAPAHSALWAARACGLPLVTTVHAAYKGNENFLKKHYNGVMVAGQATIAISHYIAGYVRQHWPHVAPTIIPRGIDVTRFDGAAVGADRLKAVRALWRVDDDEKIIFFPARVSRIKGHEMVVRIARALQPWLKKNNATLMMAGDVQADHFAEEIKFLTAPLSHIRMVPHVADMPAAYAASQLVLVPSQVPEGFGRVPVEAAAMGVPVLASNLGALPEVMPNTPCHTLVPHDDAAAWARAIQAMWEISQDEKAKAAAAARHFVTQHYDEHRMVAETLKIYENLAKK